MVKVIFAVNVIFTITILNIITNIIFVTILKRSVASQSETKVHLPWR